MVIPVSARLNVQNRQDCTPMSMKSVTPRGDSRRLRRLPTAPPTRSASAAARRRAFTGVAMYSRTRTKRASSAASEKPMREYRPRDRLMAAPALSLSLGRYSRIGFSLAALLALFVLVRLYIATPVNARRRAAALALLVGGAVGNLLNRLLSPRGVTDFIDIGVQSWRFWTFNLADTGITIGAALLLVVLSRERSFGVGAA